MSCHVGSREEAPGSVGRPTEQMESYRQKPLLWLSWEGMGEAGKYLSRLEVGQFQEFQQAHSSRDGSRCLALEWVI